MGSFLRDVVEGKTGDPRAEQVLHFVTVKPYTADNSSGLLTLRS